MRRKRLKDLETEIREETGLRYSRDGFMPLGPKTVFCMRNAMHSA